MWTRSRSVACLVLGLLLNAPIWAQNVVGPIPPPYIPEPAVPVIIPTSTFVFFCPAPRSLLQSPFARPLVYRPIKRDTKAADRLTIVGDRFFRAKNYPRAVERYERACEVDPKAAEPRVGLALIALERENFIEAAGRFREAHAADPGWLSGRPRDIEAIYGEPSRFADAVAKLETRVQTHPDDRDSWLILGAHWFLSGRLKRSYDVFLRLNDGKPDSTVVGFLAAIDLRLIEEQRRADADKK